MTLQRIGIIGCGLMGRGIAEVTALAGYDTVVREISQELLDRGLDQVRGSLGRSVAKGRLDAVARDQALSRLRGVVELDELADRQLVIEAIVENLADKIQLFAALDHLLDATAILATNTSSLTVTQLAAATERPDRFLGLHFFNPVPAMKLVEVVRTLSTSDGTERAGRSFVESLGKTPVLCQDHSGFIVNRLLVPYLLDAIRAHQNGAGSLEDIDTAMRLGCGHPMGPFTLLDFIGLDTIYFIADIMFDEYRETRFAPPPLLKQMVQAGRLGKKSGRGFYDYGEGASR